jgi:hypothetical protein
MYRGRPAQPYEIFVGADFFTLAFLSLRKVTGVRGSAPRLNGFIQIKKSSEYQYKARSFTPHPRRFSGMRQKSAQKSAPHGKSFSPCSVGPAKF